MKPLPGIVSAVSLFLIGTLALLGCETTSERKGFRDSDDVFRAGQYARALRNYQIAISEGLPANEEEWSRYRIAVCYFEMKAYADARKAMEDYVTRYPTGAYLAEVKSLYARLSAEEQRRQRERTAEFANLVGEMQRLQGLLKQDPENATHHYDLADLYWRLGDFRRSAQHYAATIRLNSRYETDDVVVKRVRLTANGEIEPRVPTFGEDIFGNEGPLRVAETSSAIEADFDQFKDRRFFVVSGKVENQSIRTFRRVNLHVTVVDMHDRLLGSRVLSLHTVPGGESIPFRASFPILNTVMNVSRYQCRLIYDY